MRGPWSLRARLVAAVVALLAVVFVVVGTVTTLALQSFLVGKLDSQVKGATSVVYTFRNGAPGGDDLPEHARTPRDPLDFLKQPGLGAGTVGAHVPGTGQGQAGQIAGGNQVVTLGGAQEAAITSVPADGSFHTRDIPGLGDYRL